MPSRHEVARQALRRAEQEAGLRAPAGSGTSDEIRRVEDETPVEASDTPQANGERDGLSGLPRASLETDGHRSARDQDADPEAVARQIVLRQLAMAPRSRKQLEDKLRQRGCDEAVAARVLDRMSEVGLVDDAAYAETLVRSKQAGAGLAAPRLRHELRRKGVERDIIDETVSGISPEVERARAEELAAKKMRTMHGLPAETQARRLAGFLARKGYSSSIVYAVVKQDVNEADEHQRD